MVFVAFVLRNVFLAGNSTDFDGTGERPDHLQIVASRRASSNPLGSLATLRLASVAPGISLPCEHTYRESGPSSIFRHTFLDATGAGSMLQSHEGLLFPLTRRARRVHRSAASPIANLTDLLMRLIRLSCAAYFVLLSVLLLTPDPLELLGFDSSPAGGGWGAHFCVFAALAFLTHAGRPPLSLRWTIVALIAYALATETLQIFIPLRCVELLDYLENLLGLAAGTIAWLAAKKAWLAWSARRAEPAGRTRKLRTSKL